MKNIFNIIFVLFIFLFVYFLFSNPNEKYTNKTETKYIPVDFQNRVYKSLKTRFSNIRPRDNKTNFYGVSVGPKEITTQHKFFEIGSKEHINDLVELHYILDLLHRFAIKHNILYSLAYGNLLGYYREGGQIFWDDDIDIILSNDYYNSLINLLENTTADNWGQHKGWKGKKYGYYLCKKIRIENVNLVLVKVPSGFYKIKLDYKYYDNVDSMSGVDVFNTDSHLKNNSEIDEMLNNENNLQMIEYHTVPNYALKKDKAEYFLNTQYGKNWKERKYPYNHKPNFNILYLIMGLILIFILIFLYKLST